MVVLVIAYQVGMALIVQDDGNKSINLNDHLLQITVTICS